MSEPITHIAIADDVRRLCLKLDSIHPSLRDAWRDHPEIARLGGITRYADKWSADVVAHVRDHPAEPNGPRKLAFVLGALTHRSIDRHMKPVFAHFKSSIDARRVAGQPVNECTIYCDMLILREVFSIDPRFSAKLFDTNLAEPRQRFEELVLTTLQRVMLRMHTIKPDSAHVHDWFENLFDAVQDFDSTMHEYERVAADPDPAKWKKFLLDTNFYDPRDPLITATRDMQRGHDIPEATIRRAIESTGESSSRYARAMKRAIDYIHAASDIFAGKTDVESAKPRMDIGVPELAMGFAPAAS